MKKIREIDFSFIGTAQNLIREINELERVKKFTFEELQRKAISMGYKGFRDSLYIGELVESENDIEHFNSSNSHVIIDNSNKIVYWTHGFKGEELFKQLSQ